MSDEPPVHSLKRPNGLRRIGWSGIGIGAIALIACELPIILAVVGLGGLSAGAVAFRPPPMIELLGGIAVLLGIITLITVWKSHKSEKRIKNDNR